MTIELPEIPAGILTLLALASPYAVALLNGLAHLTGWAKRALSVVVSMVLAAVVIGFYFLHTGDVLPNWTSMLLLAVVVSQASYGLVTKNSAKALEQRVEVGVVTMKANRDPHQEEHSIILSENADGPSLEDVGGWEELAEPENEYPDSDNKPRGRYAE